MPVGDRRRGGFGLVLLFYQIFGGIGLSRIPPATLIITALQILLYMRVIKVPWHGLDDVCLSVHKVWGKKEYRRLFIGAFEHADDWHLYYNMVSFIWKGITLERFFGSGRFFFIVSVFTCLCNITLIALSKLLGEIYDDMFYYQCAVGFSGVIFALKVLTTHYWPANQGSVMGIPVEVPAKYLVWVELILIQLLVPNVSFVGHLAGVLVGIAYIHTPLKSVMSRIWSTMAAVLFATPQPYRQFPPTGDTWGYPNDIGSDNWRTRFSPYGNEYQWDRGDGLIYPPNSDEERSEELRSTFSAASEEDAMLQRAIEESLRERNFDFSEGFVPEDFGSREPSAPMPEPSGDLPYPEHYSNVPLPNPSDHLPYPQEPAYPLPSNSNRLYPDLDEIRRRRLQKFQSS